MSTEPTQATAGDTLSWTRVQPDYPASAGWILTYYFGLATTTKNVTATTNADGESFDVAVDLSTWGPGLWRWSARVSSGTQKITIDSGVLTLAPDPSTAYDRRSHAEKCLAAIEAVIEGQMGDPIVEYEIDGVKAKKLPHDQLVALRAKYLSIVNRQKGKGLFSLHPVRFWP